MDGATRRNRMNKCIYCSSEKRVCSLCTPNMYGGKAEVYIKRVTEHDYPVLELSYYKGKSVERDCMVLNFCPICGRDLRKENADD